MRLLLSIILLTGLAACAGAQPEPGTGAAAAPATQGGLAGPQEGSPLNARNLGSGPTTTMP